VQACMRWRKTDTARRRAAAGGGARGNFR